MIRSSEPRGLGMWGLGLTLLLTLVGWLQYRWIGELSQADRERAVLGIERAAVAFAHDFDRVVSRMALRFAPSAGARFDGSKLLEVYHQWRRTAAYPELVRGIYLRSGGPAATWSQLDFDSGRRHPSALPPELRVLEQSRFGSLPFNLRGMAGRGARLGPLNDELPALILPLRGDRRRSRNLGMGSLHTIVLWLDQQVISTRILPDLAARHFATQGEPFRLVIVRRSDPTTAVYRSGDPTDHAVPSTTEVAVGLFRLLPVAEMGGVGAVRRRGGDSSEPLPSGRSPHMPPTIYELVSRASEPRWDLLAEHPGGSVDEAVRQARRRNLGLSVGVLGVLAVALALLLAATRRIQRLARQQLDFVAGVTHELRTPIAAMRVAGQNLADGVVHEPDRVRRYGVLVEREGRRLTAMIEQVLAFAGIQAGRRTYRREAVSVPTVVEAAIEEMRLALDQAEMVVECAVPRGLPVIEGDETALVQALRNLIENAVKYAAEGGWLGIEGKPTAGGGVAILVSDRGPGIARQDRGRLFEPFVRGGLVDAAIGHVGGSGLGLSLVRDIVEGHGGTVDVASEVGRGSVFTIHLQGMAVEGGA